MNGSIELETADHVATITLNRPAKHNAITPSMALALAQACQEVDRNGHIRVVVIRGEGGRAFSAGSDLNALAEIEGVWQFRNRVEYAAVVRAIRKPVIALLQGWVLGGGLEIAISADIRIASRGAKFGAPEVQRGWVGGGGASQVLPRLVGMGQAMSLLLSGNWISAERALAVGLVEEVCDESALLPRVNQLAKEIAAHSPVATQAVKAAIRAATEMPLSAGIQYENELHVVCMQDKDHREGIAAFQQKRNAKF